MIRSAFQCLILRLRRIVPLVSLLVFISFNAQAELIDRGNNMFYDTKLDITWIVDTKLAKTLGYDDNGIMPFADAHQFAQDLVYSGFDDWRLPYIHPQDGSSSYSNYPCYDGACDTGYNISGPPSELGYLYHQTLGNTGSYNPDLSYRNCGGNRTTPCPENLEPLINMGELPSFWFNVGCPEGAGDCSDWAFWGQSTYCVGCTYIFSFFQGLQNYVGGSRQYAALIVRDGDVGPQIPTYSCEGFTSPADQNIVVKRPNRVIPLRFVLRDKEGSLIYSIEPPVLQVNYSSPLVTGEGIEGIEVDSAGAGDDGNRFYFDGEEWSFNLKTKGLASGKYTLSVSRGAGEYELANSCVTTLVIE